MAGDGSTVLLTRPAAQSRRFADQSSRPAGAGGAGEDRAADADRAQGPAAGSGGGGRAGLHLGKRAEAFAALGGHCAGPAYAVGGCTAAVTRRLGFAPVGLPRAPATAPGWPG